MKKKVLLVFLLLTLITFTLCRESNDDSNMKVLAGIDESMTHVVLDTVCGFYEVNSNNDEEYFEIDLDKDGTADIQLQGRQSYWHGPAGYYTKISCLHDSIFIAVEQYTDTVFYRKYIEITDGDKVQHKTFHYYSCSRYSIEDSVFSFRNEIVANTAQHGMEINNDLFWMSETIILRHYNYPYGIAIPGIINETSDTVFYDGSSHTYNCRNLPQGQDIYLCIKLKKSNKEHFAWLKIRLEDNYKIYILDYAINLK